MNLLIASALSGSPALAASPTINLASVASETEGLTVSLGSGAAVLAYGPLPAARASLEFHADHLRVTASTTTYFGSEPETFNLLGAAWSFGAGERFQTGPVLNVAHHRGSSDLDQRLSLRAGWSLDAQGERFGFDMTVSLAGLGWHPAGEVETPLYPLALLDTVTSTELGLRRTWGHHRARVGLFGILPCVGYAWDNGTWRIRGDLATIGTRNLAWLAFGRHL